ncbi:sulfatase [Bythopirellula polymerisocia]|uniref:Choline-sulfatase n=1 Tax=Bythopirellula polymerisocia TaxID=2528003 RepID=A0A5C6CWX4_9BACT|nr:sulfatase [Bythopirellula polymerisocia]TWU27516.1 Choline-sulfatase [Bythopirellula polymerisocia]
MSRTDIGLLIPTCLVLFLFFGFSNIRQSVSAADSTRPNVLFIVTDDMNNDLGCYGNSRVNSPHIDELASRGMQFERAYCQVTVCNPSRVSMLSGLRPDNTQVYTLTEQTRSHLGDWVMLPEYFRKQGYFTAQIGKIYHTDDGFEDPRSWDVEIREFGKRPPEEEILLGADPDGPGEHTNDWSVLKTPDEETPDGIVARKAIEIMEEVVGRGEPFFLGVGFRRPHAPFAAPKKYFDMYPPDSIELPLSTPDGYYESLPPAAINYPAPEKPLSEKEQRELIAAYYACNSFVDAQVGVLLEAVDRLGIADNTVIVFVSDHGYHLGDHGGFWHKMSLFEEADRVPLIIYAPGMKAPGKKTDQLVELIDLYPTLVSLAGLPERENLDGINLTEVLDDPAKNTKLAAFTVVSRSTNPAADHAKTMDYLGRTVRTDRWRYTEWDDGKRGVELYDHQSDPRELVNLAEKSDLAETRQQLKKLLKVEQNQ